MEYGVAWSEQRRTAHPHHNQFHQAVRWEPKHWSTSHHSATERQPSPGSTAAGQSHDAPWSVVRGRWLYIRTSIHSLSFVRRVVDSLTVPAESIARSFGIL